MITFSVQDLVDYGAIESPSTLILLGTVFARGESFSIHRRSQAEAMAESNLRKGRACLLVDSDVSITVWVEMQGHSPLLHPDSFPETDSESSAKEPHQLTYRGRPSSVPIVSRASGKHRSQEQTLDDSLDGRSPSPSPSPKRKMQYRGQWIEVD